MGWPGERSARLEPFELRGNQLVPVPISPSELDGYYEGFSNTTLWPLFHDMATIPQYHRQWWERYREVNLRFATAADAASAPGATVWIHDYQLMLVPRLLRERRPDLRIGFFLHIPFPPPELFAQLPWRGALAHGVLGADLLGFQTDGDLANFSRVAQIVAGSRPVRGGLDDGGRHVGLGAFPISRRHAAHPRGGRVRQDHRPLRAGAGRPRLAGARDPRRRPARLHQGDHRAPARVQRAARGRCDRGARARRCSSRWPCPAGRRSAAYAQEERSIAQLVTETNGKFADIGRTAGALHLRAACPSTSCSRCTAPPTSWWSPRCATA